MFIFVVFELGVVLDKVVIVGGVVVEGKKWENIPNHQVINIIDSKIIITIEHKLLLKIPRIQLIKCNIPNPSSCLPSAVELIQKIVLLFVLSDEMI